MPLKYPQKTVPSSQLWWTNSGLCGAQWPQLTRYRSISTQYVMHVEQALNSGHLHVFFSIWPAFCQLERSRRSAITKHDFTTFWTPFSSNVPSMNGAPKLEYFTKITLVTPSLQMYPVRRLTPRVLRSFCPRYRSRNTCRRQSGPAWYRPPCIGS